MRAITVCVDYADYLAITAPYNIGHFEELWIVTSPSDQTTLTLCHQLNTLGSKIKVFATNAFTENGALFNKWKALEQGLDAMGREGILCIMDADILWPHNIRWNGEGREGYLFTPMRRMYNPSNVIPLLPPESEWHSLPLHPQQHEWAGYSQIFHASDSVLGPPPWHETNWMSAGSADSFFQQKWPRERKLRPSFQCLHLGEAGLNWCGRVTAFLDGTFPPEAVDRRNALQQMLAKRRGKSGMERFEHERL